MIIHQLQKKKINKQIIIFCVSFVKHVFYDTNVRVFWGMTKSSFRTCVFNVMFDSYSDNKSWHLLQRLNAR